MKIWMTKDEQQGNIDFLQGYLGAYPDCEDDSIPDAKNTLKKLENAVEFGDGYLYR